MTLIDLQSDFSREKV